MKNLIIIPARAGSKSIPNKNMRDFCGKPLIYWAIKTALEADIGSVFVSTDGNDIRDYSISQGALCPHLRPSSLSGDASSTESVLVHVVNEYGFDEVNDVFLLQPTSPFRVAGDLISASQALALNSLVTSVFSVREAIANLNPAWMLVRESDNIIRRFNGEQLEVSWGRRQDLKPTYIRNDYIYALRKENLRAADPNLYGENPQLLISDPNRIEIDLNSEIDWLVAETLFEKFKIHE